MNLNIMAARDTLAAEIFSAVDDRDKIKAQIKAQEADIETKRAALASANFELYKLQNRWSEANSRIAELVGVQVAVRKPVLQVPE